MATVSSMHQHHHHRSDSFSYRSRSAHPSSSQSQQQHHDNHKSGDSRSSSSQQHHPQQSSNASSQSRRSSHHYAPPKPEFGFGDIVAARFQIVQVIGQGTYGDVYLAKDLASAGHIDVAVKIDRFGKTMDNLLANEHKILKDVANSAKSASASCCPLPVQLGKVASRPTDQRYFLAMTRHGDSLSTIRKKYQTSVPLSICAKLFHGMVEALENFHNAGYIHRDIKPSNFLFDTSSCCETAFNKVVIIDFGLSVRFREPDGKMRDPEPCKVWVGTTRYASLAVHKQEAVSRADDILSLMFVFLEFLGRLVWLGVNDREAVLKKKESFLDRVSRKNIPVPMIEIIEHLKVLGYNDAPDYAMIKSKILSMVNMPWNEEPPVSSDSIRKSDTSSSPSPHNTPSKRSRENSQDSTYDHAQTKRAKAYY